MRDFRKHAADLWDIAIILVIVFMAVVIGRMFYVGLTDPIHLPAGPRLGPYP